MSAASPRPALVVYKEIASGDLRKLLATSNDAPTGGGARDLRLPARTFGPIMRQIFTQDGIGRGGRQIKVSDIVYLDANSKPSTTQLEYWPATSARPAEDRIAKVHASPALGGKLPATDKGRVFVLFTKFSNGQVRCDYAYEDDLRRKDKWAHEIRLAILECVASADLKNANRKKGLVSVQGFYDFNEGTGFCHAD